MSRLGDLQQIADGMIEGLRDPALRRKAYVHSYGVAQAAALLAARRGMDPELAAVCGLLHDLHAYQVGTYEDHHLGGAVLAGEILEGMAAFLPEEIELVKTAILHHDERHEVHGLYDEVLKDADILQPYLNALAEPSTAVAAGRLRGMLGELGL